MGLVIDPANVDNAWRRGQSNWGSAVEGHPVSEASGSAIAAPAGGRDQELFFAEIEHKVKTAMSVLQGWAITLDERWDRLDDAGRRQAVSVIRRTADSVVQQCEQILEDARLQVTVADIEPEVVDLVAVVRGAAPMAGSGGHPIVCDSDGPVVARAVPHAVHQIMGHLVDNAEKYSPSGTPVVLRAREEGSWAVLEVVDRGVGIPEGDEQVIFEPFRRGTQSAVSGAGLGLFIVRKLAEAMGGSVSADRNASGGSTFVVRLPAAPMAPAPG